MGKDSKKNNKISGGKSKSKAVKGKGGGSGDGDGNAKGNGKNGGGGGAQSINVRHILVSCFPPSLYLTYRIQVQQARWS